MKKTVQIVSIPINKQGFSINDLIKKPSLDAADEVERWKISYYGMSTGIWKAQQLLVLSDDEIQGGDWYLFDNVYVRKDGGYVENKNHRYKKIIASYPHIEDTLPISKETVQAWIDAGIPGKGSVEMVGRCPLQTCDNPACRKECQEVEMVCKLWKGNLLLEFSENGFYNLFPIEQCRDLTKPSIPTDEEIEEKAIEVIKSLEGEDDFRKLTAFELLSEDT